MKKRFSKAPKKLPKPWIKRLQHWIFGTAIFIGLIVMGLKFYTPKAAIPLIEGYAKKQGIELKIDRIESWFPFRCHITHFVYEKKGLGILRMEDTSVQLAKLPMIKRSIRIDKFTVKRARLELSAHTSVDKKTPITWPNAFFGINLRNLNIVELTFLKPGEKPFILSVNAKGYISKGAEKIELNTKIHEKAPYEEVVELGFKASKKTKIIHLEANFLEKGQGWLEEQLKSFLPLDTIALNVKASGHIAHWLALIKNHHPKNLAFLPPIRGSLDARVSFKETQDKNPWLRCFFSQTTGAKAQFAISHRQILEIKECSVKGAYLLGKVQGKINLKEKSVRGLDAHIELNSWPKCASSINIALKKPLQLEAKVQGPFENLALICKWYKQDIGIHSTFFNNLSGQITSNLEKGNFSGKAESFFYIENRRFNAEFIFSQLGKNLVIKPLVIKSAGGSLTGEGVYSFVKGNWDTFDFALDTQNTNFFQKHLLPEATDLKIGHFVATGNYSQKDDDTGSLKINGDITHLEFKEMFASDANINADISNPFITPRGDVNLSLQNVHISKVHVPKVDIDAQIDSRKGAFSIRLEHLPEECMALNAKGRWSYGNDHIAIYLREVFGNIREFDFQIGNSTEFNFSQGNFRLEPMLMKIGTGFIAASINTGDVVGLSVKLQDVPTALISLIDPKITAKGTVSGDFIYQGQAQNPNAHAHFVFSDCSLEYVHWPVFHDKEAITRFKLQQNVFSISTSVQSSGKQDLYFGASIPVEIQAYPFYMELDRSKPFHANVQLDTNIADFSEYLSASGHSLSGHVSGGLTFSETLNHPSITGSLNFANGQYENYESGLILRNFSFDLIGRGDKLDLEQFSSYDPKQGRITAKGTINANFNDNFPFDLKAIFSEALIVNLDNNTAKSTGILSLKGNFKKALLKGKLNISSANLDIPDKLQAQPPSLNIEFVGGKKQPKTALKKSPMVLNFDVHFNAPNTLTVQGRGLKSIWGGSVHAQGSSEDFKLFGKLSVHSGSFKFAKISFNLTEGTITFDGPLRKTTISLVAEQAVNDLNVYIALRGPLASPRLTLSSVPDIPLSNLLSRILFNKDISEIDPFQALQLAQTALELSSGEVSVTDRIQNSMGLDVFSFTSSTYSNSGDNDPNTDNASTDAADSTSVPVAVQVGKYITRGVLLTMTQGTTAESAKYNIDIDLQYGLMLQLETMQNREGKIALKWNKTY